MSATQTIRELTPTAEALRPMKSLAAAMGIVTTDRCAILREQTLHESRLPMLPFLFDFIGREPFGFAFCEGREARFRVPSGHRFVMEHIHIVCWAKDDHVDVQLVTSSARTFCNLSSMPATLQPTVSGDAAAEAARPICVQGSTVSTFLFSHSEVQNTSVVPPDTYVQVWGYLEPVNDVPSF